MINFDTSKIPLGAKPDFVMAEESLLHKSYPDMFRMSLDYAMQRATREGLLVTGFIQKRDELSGNEHIYLIKWKRVP